MKSLQIRMQNVEYIHVLPGRRAVKEETVLALMESIQRIGLQTPLAVRLIEEINIPGEGAVCDVPLLVAGAHRLEACKRLGIELVPVVDFPDEREARLWEISENLHRADLSDVERSENVNEWRMLTLEKGRQVATPLGGHQPHDQGYEKTAAVLGISERAVRRAEIIASLPAAAKAAAAELGLDDNQSALLAAAKAPDPVAHLHKAKATKDEAAAKPRSERSISYERWNDLVAKAWNKGEEEWQDRWIAAITDAPIKRA